MKLHEAADAHLTSLGIPYVGLALLQEKPPKWRIDFTPEATPAQKAAGENALRNFVPPADPPEIDLVKLTELLESKGVLTKQEVVTVQRAKK